MCRRNRKVCHIFLFLILLFSSRGYGQDIDFSQFMDAPLWRNPALAGIFNGDVRVQAIYRNQWSTINNVFNTGSLNAEVRKPIGNSDDFFTIGMQAIYDKAGSAALTTTEVLPALNFNKSLDGDRRKFLSMGFMAGMVQRRIDRSKVTTDNTYEYGSDGEANLFNQYSYFDGSFGLSYNANFSDFDQDNYYLGVAYHHFNKPKNHFFSATPDQLDPKIVISGGISWLSSEISMVKVEGDYVKQGAFSQVRGSVLFGYILDDYYDDPQYTIWGGCMIRVNDAVAPIVKLYYKPFTFSASFDLNYSRLRPASNSYGAIELSLLYTGFTDKFKNVLDKTKCPKF